MYDIAVIFMGQYPFSHSKTFFFKTKNWRKKWSVNKNSTEKNRDEDDVTKNTELDEKIVPKDEQITLNIPRSYLHIFKKCAVR